MTELVTIARLYAKALLDIASTNRVSWITLVQELSQIVYFPEVLSVVSNPKMKCQQIVDLLLSELKSPLKSVPAARNFVQMLVENHRVRLLPEIATQFSALDNTEEGLTNVTIESAFSLDGDKLSKLVVALERKFQRKLKPILKLNPALIGGVRVTVGDEVLDTSVRARIADMQAALIA
ncbi:F0F1 ATP synthase subunit delta [Candidatus Vallotia lariciata]|uniref:F0F1 ATP synthase subunit delta n=1 Tax=Candidatus Vallotia laricis TaxID=2018052 RepID=UPI001D033DE4|nr:F0F1 ATP synthase subunit delta [Candidatus Vallotia lariciata]UDG82696.1 ATP synthase subunit delta [Candidatus Vallotia lariciata]